MAVDFGSTNAGRNYTTPDSSRLSLPAGDWTWLTFFKPNDNTGFPYFLSHGGTYGASNSLQCFNNGGSGWAVKVAALTDQNWGGGALTVGAWTVGYATRRGGNLYAGAGLMGDPTTVSESAGTAISTAYNPTGLLKIGIRSDLTSDATYATKSIISDVIYLPGIGFNPDLLTEVLRGQYLDRAGWWHKRRFHAYLPYAKEFLVDLTGRHALTRNGSGYTRGATEQDSVFRRISEPTILAPLVTAAGGTQAAGSADGTSTVSGVGASTAEADGTAAGVGAVSGVGASTAEADGTAAGTSTATAEAVSGNYGTAAGASTVSGMGASTAEADGTAAGVSAASGVGASTAEADGTAAGVGAVSGVGASTAEADGTAAGTSTVSGVGDTGASAGTAAGTSLVLGIGISTAEALGSAAGTSTVSGVGTSDAGIVVPLINIFQIQGSRSKIILIQRGN